MRKKKKKWKILHVFHKVPFSIERYKDDVLYGVVPMHADDILLGRH